MKNLLLAVMVAVMVALTTGCATTGMRGYKETLPDNPKMEISGDLPRAGEVVYVWKLICDETAHGPMEDTVVWQYALRSERPVKVFATRYGWFTGLESLEGVYVVIRSPDGKGINFKNIGGKEKMPAHGQ